MSTPPSFTHFDLPGDFHLAINSNKKMKTVLITVSVIGNLDETVTRKAILPMILRRGTRSYPDMRSINRYLEGLYGASLAGFVQKIGEWHLVRFRLDVVNEKFLPGEKGLLRRALEFLKELLRDPLLVDGGFLPEFLEQEKNNLKLTIESLVDNKDAYAAQRLNEEMCRDEPYRFYEEGRVEDIPAIDPTSLAGLHRFWIRGYPLHVYLTGDIDMAATRDLVEEVLWAPRDGGYRLSGIPQAVSVREAREVRERMEVNQAKLHLGFRHAITYTDPRYQALLVMNGVLGASGFSHSKLFQNVREKANLAYSVHSSLDRTKGLLLVASGIAAENYEKAVSIILDQIRAVQDGQVTDEEIQAAVAMILSSNEMLEDNLGALGDVDFTWRLHGRRFDFIDFRERLRRVDRDGIIEAARCLSHDTTYLLAP